MDSATNNSKPGSEDDSRLKCPNCNTAFSAQFMYELVMDNRERLPEDLFRTLAAKFERELPKQVAP